MARSARRCQLQAEEQNAVVVGVRDPDLVSLHGNALRPIQPVPVALFRFRDQAHGPILGVEDFDGIVTLNGRLYGTFNCLDSSQIFPVFYVDRDNMNLHSIRIEDLKAKGCIGFVRDGVIDYKVRT